MANSDPSSHPVKRLGIEIFQKSAWLLSQEVIDLVLAFTFTFIALRRLGPEAFGLLNLTQATLNISGLATFNMELALIRLVPDARELQNWDQARWMIKLAQWIKGGLAGLVVIILFFLAPVIAKQYNQPILELMIRIGCLSLVSAAIADVGAAACLSLLHPEVRTFVTTMRRSIEVTGLLIITSLRTQASDAILVLAIADTSAAIAYTLATRYFLGKDPHPEQNFDLKHTFQRMWQYAYPLFGARLTDVGGRELGKLFLGQIASAQAVGYYSVARLAIERLTSLLSQPPLAAIPVIARSEPGERLVTRPKTNQITLNLFRYQMILTSLGGLVIWAIAPIFIQVIGGPEYDLAIPALRILTFGLICWSGTAALHALFLVYERTVGIFILNSVLILTTISLYGFFVGRWQTSGAATSDSIGQFLTLLLGLFLGLRWFQFPATQGFKLIMQITIPAILIGLPILVLPQNLAVEFVWLVISVVIYLTYLLLFEIIPTDLWEQTKLIKLPEQLGLSALQSKLISGLVKYQNWLLVMKGQVSRETRVNNDSEDQYP